MQFIRNFESLFGYLSDESRARVRVAVVCPHDDHTLEAVENALNEGFADFVLVGKAAVINNLSLLADHADRVELVEVEDPDEAARVAVGLVREGRADVLMKGLINTDNLLRAVLNKECGLLPKGNVLTHVTAAQIPGRDKLLFFSDAAVIPFPTLDQRVATVGYIADLCRSFGIETPRIALIHCSEKLSPKFPVTADYAELKERAADGAFGNAIVDGPMDVKTAVDAHSGAIKGIKSPIDGQADALIFPDIEAGNVFYKTITCFAGSLNAGMLMGTSAPVVVSSRSDTTRSKLCSLAMACLAASSGK